MSLPSEDVTGATDVNESRYTARQSSPAGNIVQQASNLIDINNRHMDLGLNTLVPMTQQDAEIDATGLNDLETPGENHSSPEAVPAVPSDVEQFEGERLNPGTVRTTVSTMRVFAGFVIKALEGQLLNSHMQRWNNFVQRVPAAASSGYNDGCPRTRINDSAQPQAYIPLLRSVLLEWKGTILPAGAELPLAVKCKTNYWMKRFVVQYRQGDSEELKAGTVVTYVRSIQRYIRNFWNHDINFFEDTVFTNKREGFSVLLNNVVADKQARGYHSEKANVLSEDELGKLFASEYLTSLTAVGFQTRLIFELFLVTGFRRKEIAQMERWQVKVFDNVKPRRICIRKRLGSAIGTAKNAQGGTKHAGKTPTEVSIFEVPGGNGPVKLYEDLILYISLRDKLTLKDSLDKRFLLAVNKDALSRNEFFKLQVVGETTVANRINKVCDNLGIKGLGGRDGISAHSFRGTNITRMLEGGQDAAAICARTGHATPNTIKRYTTPHGRLGEQMQQCITDIPGGALDDAPSGVHLKRPKLDDGGTPAVYNSAVKDGDSVVDRAAFDSNNEKNPPTIVMSSISTSGGSTVNLHIHQHF